MACRLFRSGGKGFSESCGVELMEWHINELSLDGQFLDPGAFKSVLEPLLRLRHRDPFLQDLMFCSPLLHERKVTAIYDLKAAVRATGDKNFIRLALGWTQTGPFWYDDRQFNENDYFEYEGIDVTNQGLGEAARRRIVGRVANTFSFPLLAFEKSPLSVQHGLSEEPYGVINVDNHWQIEQLTVALEACRVLNNWNDVQEEINRRFDQLIFSTDVMDKLLPMPFSKSVTERIFQLLRILNQVVLSRDDGGKLSDEGEEILRNHFAGAGAGNTPLFKPESADNRRNFKNELTFQDPSDNSKYLDCHWHGKIQTPQIRIHFEWPTPRGQREIKIVYIGPKITKD